MHCFARELLIAENTRHSQKLHESANNSKPRFTSVVGKELSLLGNHREDHLSYPDARTFVALFNSFDKKLALSMGFEDALELLESIYTYMKQWDEQIQWSKDNQIVPKGSSDGLKPVINIFSFNTLIKALSKLPATSWEESYQRCVRIDELMREWEEKCEGMERYQQAPQLREPPLQPDQVTHGLAIYAWTKCSEWARLRDDDSAVKQRFGLCADKAAAHLDTMFAKFTNRNSTSNKRNGNNIFHAINDVIALYGKASSPTKADSLFQRAKESDLSNLAILSTIVGVLSDHSAQDISHAQKAYQYLLDFERDTMRLNESTIIPDMKYTAIYNSVISGFLNADRKDLGLNYAQSLLSHIVSSHESNPRHIARPNTTSFVKVMSVLANRGSHIGELGKLLQKMEELDQRRKGIPRSSPNSKLAANVSPNEVVYNLLLKAYVRSNSSESLQSAKMLLEKKENDPDISRDDRTRSMYTTLLNLQIGVNTTQSIDSVTNCVAQSFPSNEKKKRRDYSTKESNLDLTSKKFVSIMNGKSYLLYVFS